MAVIGSIDRERETSSGGHYISPPLEIPASLPRRLVPSLSLSPQERRAVYLFYMNLPF